MLNSRRLFSVMNPGPLGTTWAVTLPGVGVGRELQLVFQGLVGLAEPVGGEDHVQRGDDGAAQAGHQLHPFAAGLAVLGVVVGRLDQVLRAR